MADRFLFFLGAFCAGGGVGRVLKKRKGELEKERCCKEKMLELKFWKNDHWKRI